MHVRTRITQVARERGLTAAEVARCLGFYPSNVSAMDAGKRSVSLKTLARVAAFLATSPADLIEVHTVLSKTPFARPHLVRKLQERDAGVPDGRDRQWVHTALLAWQRHYRRSKS